MFFVNITCDIGLLAVASPVAQHVVGMDAAQAASMVGIIGLLNGGGFSCMPAYFSDIFGTRELSAIHGRVLTAWGVAGVVGPTIVSWFWEHTHSYTTTLTFFAGCFVLNFLIATVLKLHGSRRSSLVKTANT